MSRRRKQKGSVWLKILIFVVVLVLAAIIFGRKGEDKPKETVWQEGSMLRIGDTQVDYREGLVYLNAVQQDYEQYYGSEIWQYAVDAQGNTMGEVIKEQTLEQIIYIKVVCQKASELGIVLSEEELQTVDRQTADYMAKLQESDLLLHGVNSDIIRRIYADNLLARKTFEVTTLNVDTDIPDEEAAQHKFYTIAIRNFKIDASGNRISYEGTEAEELAARVENLRAQALESTDFYKFASANTEDSDMLEITGGIGDFPAEYEDAVLALNTGEISEVVKKNDYYYIFYCVTDFDVDATHEKKEEMIAQRQEEEFKNRYQEWREIIPVEVHDEIWDALDFDMKSVG
ncbi:MAG: SurA N-terminal domain-containing protein [Lachnospiraceae bacterium]|nr:SurA N-terminal domain-containing protein [Lachnospiraceae bacterium]MBP3578175.1 SurA N-terminal domain-containing protein [Lachnospiraceae bacterium]